MPTLEMGLRFKNNQEGRNTAEMTLEAHRQLLMIEGCTFIDPSEKCPLRVRRNSDAISSLREYADFQTPQMEVGEIYVSFDRWPGEQVGSWGYSIDGFDFSITCGPNRLGLGAMPYTNPNLNDARWKNAFFRLVDRAQQVRALMEKTKRLIQGYRSGDKGFQDRTTKDLFEDMFGLIKR